MYALKIDATIAANHHLSIDLPTSFPVGEAEVIILAKTADPVPTSAAPAMQHLLNWLDALPASGRSAEEIEAQIRDEREAWDE